jgi:hypothetical protein
MERQDLSIHISPGSRLRIILHDTLLAAENLTPPFMRALAQQVRVAPLKPQ